MRDKGVILTYYVVPLVFFAFMGGIFTSIDPNAYKTLISSMTVFGVTMGAMEGSPARLVELFGSDMKKAYMVGGIPLWTAVVNNFISAFVHLFTSAMNGKSIMVLLLICLVCRLISAYYLKKQTDNVPNK